MSLIHNERWKLTASWLNTIAAGSVIAGCVTPLVALAYGLRTGPEAAPTWIIVMLTLVWISVGVALHDGQSHSREIAGMTTLEVFAVFGVPALLLAIGAAALYLSRQNDDRHPRPGE